MIQTIVERIYIVDKNDERFCHIFIKGCTDEDYTGFFQTAGYIGNKITPLCVIQNSVVLAKAPLQKQKFLLILAKILLMKRGSTNQNAC